MTFYPPHNQAPGSGMPGQYSSPQPPLPPMMSQAPYAPQDEPGKKKKKGKTVIWIVVTLSLLFLLLLLGGCGIIISSLKDSRGGVPLTGDDTTSSLPAIPSPQSRPPAPEGSVQAVAEKVLPSVVSIQVGVNGRQIGSGSGVILSNDGLILTNAHVIRGGQEFAIITNDNAIMPATIVGIDEISDIALIKAQSQHKLTPIELGSSQNLAVGQPVVAVGAPLGLSGTVTSGIISALNRPVHVTDAQGRGETVMNAIQTDAAINPGNSGGALVDMSGRLIGINSAIVSIGGTQGPFGGQGGNIGLGFAIPVDQAHRIATDLAKGGPVRHSFIGVTVAPSVDPLGSEITALTPGGSAEKAGLRVGDVILKVDGRAVDPVDGLVAYVRSRAPGSTITLTVASHGGNVRDVPVRVGAAKE